MSIVRNNLMTRPGYTPYCGDASCIRGMPRSDWSHTKEQFTCGCGWVSTFPADFIEGYKAYRETWDEPNLANRQGYGNVTAALEQLRHVVDRPRSRDLNLSLLSPNEVVGLVNHPDVVIVDDVASCRPTVNVGTIGHVDHGKATLATSLAKLVAASGLMTPKNIIITRAALPPCEFSRLIKPKGKGISHGKGQRKANRRNRWS